MAQSQIQSLLGSQAEFLLDHSCKTIDKSMIHASLNLTAAHKY
jgi:hypothetical protein